jgi:DNA-binding MarR family transcriptional regulator
LVRELPAVRAFRSLLGAQSVVTELHRRHLAETYGLALGEFDMVAELGNTSGLRMGDLAKKMITSPANVTRIAALLEGRGWVVRQRASGSDREVVAALTPAGDAFFQAHFREVVDYTCNVMESALGKDELITLASLCHKLRAEARPPSEKPAAKKPARGR